MDKNTALTKENTVLIGENTALPEAYLRRMEMLLGDEFESFLKSYEDEPVKGLRFNKNKVRQETIEKLINEWSLKKVPWCGTGYYYSDDIRPGLSPYHAAGVFYIQEPSAMLTVEEADIGENDIILDLCASPGGKSTQSAERCRLLVSNEPIPKRARTLSSNIERMGFANTIVTSAYPDALADALAGFFDKVIADAPCSGEGMMRKDTNAANEWSEANVRLCIERQSEILNAADRLVKSGGSIIYSTCTFEPGENEEQINKFLHAHPNYVLIKTKKIFPHKEKGEGHFCAVIKKDGESKSSAVTVEALAKRLKTSGIHVLRQGVEKSPADIRDKSYSPTHAEAMAKSYESDSGLKIEIIDYADCIKYLHGESFRIGDEINLRLSREDKGELKGWGTVYYDRYPIGNAKIAGGVLKNHYPKGLRFMG